MPAQLDAFSTFALAKSGRNIANPQDATALAQTLARERLGLIDGPRARAIERWLLTTARKAWIKSGPATALTANEAQELHAQGHAWALSAFDTGTLARLDLGEPQRRQAMEIIDYLMSDQAPRAARLSFDDALAQTQTWHASLARQKTLEEDPQGIQTFLELDDGSRWVKVLSPQSLSREGALMRHCVGSYAQQVAEQSCQILSLRSSDNRPLLTLELAVLDDDDDPVRFDQARAVCFEQVRGRSNAMPRPEHADALRSMADELERLGLPIRRAQELAGSGLALNPDTQKLALFAELPAGFPIAGNVEFHRRVPDGIERVQFSGDIVIFQAPLPQTLHIDAPKITLVDCQGDRVHVKACAANAILVVHGAQQFRQVHFEADSVEVLGQPPKNGWQSLEGASLRDLGAIHALLGLGPQPDSIHVQADTGFILGASAREIRLDSSFNCSIERCAYDQALLQGPVSRFGCLERREPAADLWATGQPLEWTRGQAEAVVRSVDKAPLDGLLQALRSRQQDRLDLLACQLGAVLTVNIGSFHRPGSLLMSQGNLVGISSVELARREHERLARRDDAILSHNPSEPWVLALSGHLDPNKIGPRLDGEPFDNASFPLSQWAAEFERQFPALAKNAREGKLEAEALDACPEAVAMLRTLARARVQMDAKQARALWEQAGGQGAQWNFLHALEDKALEDFGSWRGVATLCFVAAPVDDDWNANEDLVKEDSPLGQALDRLRDELSDAHFHLHPTAQNLDEVAACELADLATMALMWPLDDVAVVAPPSIPKNVLDAVKPPLDPRLGLACAVLGIATAKACGEPDNALVFARGWMDHLAHALEFSPLELAERSRDLGLMLAGHIDFDREPQSLLEACAKTADLRTWANDDPSRLVLIRAQSAQPWDGADLRALREAVGDDPVLGPALMRAAEVSKIQASPFDAINREDLEAFIQHLGWHQSSPLEKAQSFQAARQFMRDDLGEGLFGPISPDGLWTVDLHWLDLGLLGGASVLARDALAQTRAQMLRHQPATVALALLDRDELAREAEQKQWSSKKTASLLAAVERARKLHPKLPPPSMVQFNSLPCNLEDWGHALAQGAKKGASVEDASLKIMGEDAHRWTVAPSVQQRKILARAISERDHFTCEMREEMIQTLSYCDHIWNFGRARLGR